MLIISGCQNFSFGEKNGRSEVVATQQPNEPEKCPEYSKNELQNPQPITLGNETKTVSERVKKGRLKGFVFEANAEQKLSYKTSDDICIWIYRPDNELLKGKTLPISGKYIIQVTTLQGETNFEIEMSLETEFEIPDLVGVWTGYYGLDNPDSTLEITQQSEKSFEGKLTTTGKEGGTFILGIEGEVKPKTREIIMKEVKYFKKPGFWRMGTNNGMLSADFRQMEGTGYDNKWDYEWKFTKQE